jgi:hypothetical protein
MVGAGLDIGPATASAAEFASTFGVPRGTALRLPLARRDIHNTVCLQRVCGGLRTFAFPVIGNP